MTDIFGVKELFPTVLGGRQYFSNWHNGSPRTFHSFNPVSSQSTDPEICFYGNTGTYVISGNGYLSGDPTHSIGTLNMYGIAPRIYNRAVNNNGTLESAGALVGYDPAFNPPLEQWGKDGRGLEITLYSLFTRKDCFQSYSGITCGAYTNHYPDNSNVNYPSGVNSDYGSRTAYGQIQAISQNVYYKRERYFPSTVSEVSSIAKTTPVPLNSWIGVKYIMRPYTNVLKFNIQTYVDYTNGLNGGTWNRIMNFTDEYGWSAQFDPPDIPLDSMYPDVNTHQTISGSYWTGSPPVGAFMGWAPINNIDGAHQPVPSNYSVFIRNDYTNPVPDAQFYKWWSIREIAPLTEAPPPTKQKNVNNLLDIFL